MINMAGIPRASRSTYSRVSVVASYVSSPTYSETRLGHGVEMRGIALTADELPSPHWFLQEYSQAGETSADSHSLTTLSAEVCVPALDLFRAAEPRSKTRRDNEGTSTHGRSCKQSQSSGSHSRPADTHGQSLSAHKSCSGSQKSSDDGLLIASCRSLAHSHPGKRREPMMKDEYDSEGK